MGITAELARINRAITDLSAKCCSPGDGLPCGTANYPQLAIGPVEEVIAFNNDETIQLKKLKKKCLIHTQKALIIKLQKLKKFNKIKGNSNAKC